MDTSTLRPAWLAGQPVETGATVDVHAPEDGRLLAQVACANAGQLEQAIEAAHAARKAMASEPAHQRRARLRDISRRIASRSEDFAEAISNEAGKPISQARTEVMRAVGAFEIAAEEATRLDGEYLPLDGAVNGEGKQGIVRRVPAGVCAFITPFNFPLNLAAHKVAPALAVGNPFVLKPAEKTPLSALLLAEVLAAAAPELPAGAWSVLPALPAECGPLTHDARVRHFSFTGSAAVGWKLKGEAAHAHTVLELGGNAAAIVGTDWDFEHALDRCAFGAFMYSGQVCISLQRMLVHESQFEAACASMAQRAANLQRGPLNDAATEIGPLINRAAAERVESWIHTAVANGATVHAGGKREGSFVEPTVLSGVPHDEPLWCDEVFGPVVVVQPYRDFDHALALADDTRYGLQASLFSHDWRQVNQAWSALEVGQLIVGESPAFRVDSMPYGGVRTSGAGREGIRYAIEAMTEPRLLVIGDMS